MKLVNRSTAFNKQSPGFYPKCCQDNSPNDSFASQKTAIDLALSDQFSSLTLNSELSTRLPSPKSFLETELPNKFENSVKYKTEICKNFEIYKRCKFGDKCCFAHGLEELRERTHLNDSYKLKVCKNYHEIGYCKYGQRCQYVHYKENEYYSDVLKTTQFKIVTKFAEQEDADLTKVLNGMTSHQNRLPIFLNMAIKKAKR